MNPKSDAELLREYAEKGSESAFAEIVDRHAGLIYSAALRQVKSPDTAADVAQSVFVGVAQGANALCARISEDASLAGWLCRSARNVALNLRRNEIRRQSRERMAMEQLDSTPETTPEWDQLGPVLDEAMSELSEPDYDAVVLRFFKNQDLLAIGRALGVSDDAAQKRVSRALDRLRTLLAQRGIATTAAGLAVILSANAVQSAPVGFAATVTSAAVLSATALAATATATKTILMTTLQKTLVGLALAAVVTTPWVMQHRAHVALREQNQALSNQVDQLSALVATNQQRSPQPASTPARRTEVPLELLRLRGEVGTLRQQNQALAKLLVDRQPPSADFEPSTAWNDQGDATPEAAAGTFAWAIKEGNTDRLAQLLQFETDQPITNLTTLVDGFSKGLQPLMSEIEASRLVLKDDSKPDEITFWYQSRFKDSNTLVSPITVKRYGDQWKVKLVYQPNGPQN